MCFDDIRIYMYIYSAYHIQLKHFVVRPPIILHIFTYMRLYTHAIHACYGVATISRPLKIIGLFCKRAL